jgi:hypothetical protein
LSLPHALKKLKILTIMHSLKTFSLKSLAAVIILLLFSSQPGFSQGTRSSVKIMSEDDLRFLTEMTKEVVDSSRILPGKMISGTIGPNNTGGTLIRPGGRDCYPSFWIRDYTMSLESGFVTAEEQLHMLLLTASTQCDKPWITKGGSLIPYGAIADHIRIDDALPVFFPGTLDYYDQGIKTFGMVPPYDDQFYFIHMAWYYIQSMGDWTVLDKKINNKSLLERLQAAFAVPPSAPGSELAFTTDEFRGVDFGFRDVITITGSLCMTSILKYRAASELAKIFDHIGEHDLAVSYSDISNKIKKEIPLTFSGKSGLLKASTGKSSQPDVWSTALAVWMNILEGEDMLRACHTLAESYTKGALSVDGNIRHVLTTDDFNGTTAWEFSLAKKNTYQNGAYWGTPTGWVCYAIAKADPGLAAKLAAEYIADLRKNDFRKGGGAPYECFHPSGFRQNPVYMTTVTCPLIVFTSMNK